MKRAFKILICFFVVLFAVMLVLLCMFAHGMATRADCPEYEPGSVWYNEETGITFTADDNGTLCGKNVVNGQEYYMTVGHRAGNIDISYLDYTSVLEEETHVQHSSLIGDYKLKKDKLIIRNISYLENISINADELIFVKQ